MTSVPASERARDDVLDDFAVEESHGREVLERYLRTYPQFALEIVDLSRELSREPLSDERPLSAAEEASIDAAWRLHEAAAPPPPVDPFASMSVDDQRRVARRLGLPRQVLIALRDRHIAPSSIPGAFLRRLAAALKADVEAVRMALSGAPATMARSFKADVKPGPSTQVALGRALADAKVPAGRIAELLSEDG